MSVAQESAREYPPFRSLPKLESNGYGEGLYVRTHYHDLEPVIDESEVIDHFRQLEVAHEFLDANGNFKMAGYLFPFDSAGLNVVRDAYRGRWPLGGQTKRETAQEDQADTDEFKGFIEGGKRSSVQSVRNDGLRESALRKYGYKCYCCGFDFREFYGEVARGRAIVHHLETFSGLDQGGRVATVDDVRVVCANCHYVIHFSKQPRDVDDLKRSIAREWTTWGTRGLSRK